MKHREQRLQAILELVAGRPEAGFDGRKLVGRICAEYEVAPATVYADIDDLVGRGWVTTRFRVVYPTPVGQKRSGRPILEDRRQRQVEDAEAGDAEAQ